MKIMIISTIRGKESNIAAIRKIIATLEKDGHFVYSDHLINTNQDRLDKMSDDENLKFHSLILTRIKQSDIVVAECSHESFSVGYLLSHAIELAKPTVIFYSSKSSEPNLVPTLIQSGKILQAQYKDLDNLEELVGEYIEYAKEKVDVRFNFFISPAIGRYLDWISKVKKIPRSVYLRALIERDIEQNKQYIDVE